MSEESRAWDKEVLSPEDHDEILEHEHKVNQYRAELMAAHRQADEDIADIDQAGALGESLMEAIRQLSAAEADDRLHVAFARRDYARQIIAGVVKTLESELRDQDEAIQNHFLALGVPSLKLTDPARTLYLDNRPYISIVESAPGEDTDAKHERAAAALRAAGLGEFVGTRCNLAGLVSHYREIIKEAGEEAAREQLRAELGEVVELGITTKARTRKAS